VSKRITQRFGVGTAICLLVAYLAWVASADGRELGVSLAPGIAKLDSGAPTEADDNDEGAVERRSQLLFDGEIELPSKGVKKRESEPSIQLEVVEGVVIDQKRTPIHKARVTLIRVPGHDRTTLDYNRLGERRLVAETSTDVKGYFTFQVTAGAAYLVEASKTGFAQDAIPRVFGGEKLVLTMMASGSLVCTVVDKATTSAVREARIIGQSESGLRFDLTTNHSGVFSIEEAPPGELNGVAISPSGATAGFNCVIVPGQTTTHRVGIDEKQQIVGTIVDAFSGVGVAGAQVCLSWGLVGPTRTGSGGDFVLGGWDPAKQTTIYACAEGYGRCEFLVDPLAAAEGSLQLEITPGVQFMGQVVDLEEQPIPGATIEIVGSVLSGGVQSIESCTSTTTDDGRFELSARSDIPLVLIASYEGLGSRYIELPQVDIRDGYSERRFVLPDILLAPELQLHGCVVDTAGNGIEGLNVLIRPTTEPNGGQLSSSLGSVRRISGKSGGFMVAGLSERTYEVSVDVSRTTERIVSLRKLDRTNTAEPLLIVLPSDEGRASIRGKLFPPIGDEEVTARMVVHATSEQRQTASSVRVGVGGEFVLDGLSPMDTYKLSVHQLLSKGKKPVSLTAPPLFGVPTGSNVSIVLAITHEIRGVLRGSNGEAAVNAKLCAWSSSGDLLDEVLSSNEGKFILRVPEGSAVTIRARSADGADSFVSSHSTLTGRELEIRMVRNLESNK